MTTSVSTSDIVAMRMRALLLTDNSFTNPVDVVRHLFAMQGQDFDAARWATAIRAGTSQKPTTPSNIADAFNSGAIVRSWPMRGTVHLMCAEDIGWMQELTNPGVLKDWNKRLDYLGLTMSTYEQVRELTQAALAEGKSLDRKDLITHFEDNGIEMVQGASYHLVWALCQNGVTVFGPMNEAGDLELVLTEEWIKTPNQYELDEAQAEFCIRYFNGHGPATVQDLMWWSKLPARAIKAGIKLAGDRLVELEANGTTYYALAEQLDAPPPTKSQLALAAFDEHLLGYKDRSLLVDPSNARKVMTINGIAQPTIVRDGRVVATWKVRDGSFEVLEGEKLTKTQLSAAENQIQAARTWLGRG